MDLHRPPWTSIDLHGPPWTSMDLHGPPWTSLDLLGPPWTSMDLLGPPWTSIDLHRPPWTSIDLQSSSNPPPVLLESSSNPPRILLESSSGPVTCDTFGPDYSSSSLACGCKSCKMCTTLLAKLPHPRAGVGIMCHTFSKNGSSSSEFLQKGFKRVTPPMVPPMCRGDRARMHSQVHRKRVRE